MREARDREGDDGTRRGEKEGDRGVGNRIAGREEEGERRQRGKERRAEKGKETGKGRKGEEGKGKEG